jgi:hypothetical protein
MGGERVKQGADLRLTHQFGQQAVATCSASPSTCVRAACCAMPRQPVMSSGCAVGCTVVCMLSVTHMPEACTCMDKDGQCASVVCCASPYL